MSEAARQKATVYVGGLDARVTVETLRHAFIPFGDIVDISLPKPDPRTSNEPHRGFAYVEFEEADDATEAVYNMDQSELFGRVIKVSKAKPQKVQGEGLGSKTALWEQEGYLTKDNAAEEDSATAGNANQAVDPMQGLEQLDVAGPKADG